MTRERGPLAQAPGGAPSRPSPTVRWMVTAAALLAALLGGWRFVARAAAVRGGTIGAALVEAGAAAEAYPLLLGAVEGWPRQAKPCVDLGDLAVWAIDDEGAREAIGVADPRSLARLAFLSYAEALDRQPGNAAAWAGMAELFRAARRLRLDEEPLDLDQIDDDRGLLLEDRLAMASYSKALRFEPNNFFYHAYLGSLYEEAGLRREAVAAWARSVEIMPELSWHYYIPGEGLAEDLYAAARGALTSALETNPTVPRERILHNLGELAARAGDSGAALEAYRSAALEAGDPSLSLYLQGEVLFEERRCPEAEEVLLAAIGPGTLQSHTLALAHTLVARCRVLGGDLEAAVTHLERARWLNGEAWYIAADLAGAYERLGRLDNAEAEYRSAIRLAPGRASAYSALIGLYRKSRRIGKAIPLAEKLVELFPDDQVFRDQLESLQRDLGEPEAGGT